MDSVVHFEIPAEDLSRAKQFYSSIFGWEIEDMPGMEYTIVRTTPVDEQQMPKEPGAINGGMFKRTEELPVPVFSINVSSVDDYLKKVETGGGTVVTPKAEIPGMGFYGYGKDPEGNIFGLWENIS